MKKWFFTQAAKVWINTTEDLARSFYTSEDRAFRDKNALPFNKSYTIRLGLALVPISCFYECSNNTCVGTSVLLPTFDISVGFIQYIITC